MKRLLIIFFILILSELIFGQQDVKKTKNDFIIFFNKTNGEKFVYFDSDYNYNISFNIGLHFINYKYPISLGYEYFTDSREVYFPKEYWWYEDPKNIKKELLKKAHYLRFYYPLILWTGNESTSLTGVHKAKDKMNTYYYKGWINHHRFLYINSFFDYQLFQSESKIIFSEKTTTTGKNYTKTETDEKVLINHKFPFKHIFRIGLSMRVLYEIFDIWCQPSFALNSGENNFNYRYGAGIVLSNMKAGYIYENIWGRASHGIQIGAYMYL